MAARTSYRRAFFQGVVIAVDPAKRELTVRVGDRTGTLTRQGMAWAGRLELVNSYGRPQSKRAIGLGAVLEVVVQQPDQNKTGAVFTLSTSTRVTASR